MSWRLQRNGIRLHFRLASGLRSLPLAEGQNQTIYLRGRTQPGAPAGNRVGGREWQGRGGRSGTCGGVMLRGQQRRGHRWPWWEELAPLRGLGAEPGSLGPHPPGVSVSCSRDHPPGAHHCGGGAGRQGHLQPRAGPSEHPLRALSPTSPLGLPTGCAASSLPSLSPPASVPFLSSLPDQ